MKIKNQDVPAGKRTVRKSGSGATAPMRAAQAPQPWWAAASAEAAPVLGLIGIGTILCCWLWGRTGEIFLDFGNELYVAWQLSCGRVLYRDVESIYGPLSSNVNGLAMEWFGPSLNTILTLNLLVLIAVTALIYALLRAISGVWAAFMGTAFFLVVFALSCQTPILNYNFLTPYAHEMTHGFLLCLATVWCIDRFYQRGTMRWAAASGLLTGMALLTKPEIALACVATLGLGLGGAMWVRRHKPIVPIGGAVLAGMIVPLLWAFFAYWMYMPVGEALSSISGGLQYIGKPFVRDMPFYREQLGTDHLGQNLLSVLLYSGMYIGIAVVLGLAGLAGGWIVRVIGRDGAFAENDWGRRLVKGGSVALEVALGLLPGIGIASAIMIAANMYFSFWPEMGRALPALAVALLMVTGWRVFRARGENDRRSVLRWTLAVLSIALLAKIFLNARAYHYGFVLAAPCGVMAVVALTGWFPAWVARHGGSSLVVRVGALGLLGPFFFASVNVSVLQLPDHVIPIRLKFGGTAYVWVNDASSAMAVGWLSLPENRRWSFAVLPDAAGMNYALGRANPVRYQVLNPMMFNIYDESKIIDAFAKSPPHFILLVTFDESALGPRFFAKDYGRRLARWIEAHYTPGPNIDAGNGRAVVVFTYESQGKASGPS